VLNDRQIQILTDGIGRASDILLGYYHKKDLVTTLKEDNSPVTEADLASNQYITELLEREFPGIPVISEENPKQAWSIRKTWDYWWILDPLDGTREFLARNDEFAINLALVHKNQPVVGLISIPAKGLLYLGIKDKGSWSLQNGVRTPLPLYQTIPADQEIIALMSRSHTEPDEHRYLKSLEDKGYKVIIRPAGSSYKHVLLAEGSAHLYAKFGVCWEWDTAPGQLIIEEAGGRVIRIDNQKPLTYNKESFANPGFIMWAPEVTQSL